MILEPLISFIKKGDMMSRCSLIYISVFCFTSLTSMQYSIPDKASKLDMRALKKPFIFIQALATYTFKDHPEKQKAQEKKLPHLNDFDEPQIRPLDGSTSLLHAFENAKIEFWIP
jgi:hypothetical protein